MGHGALWLAAQGQRAMPEHPRAAGARLAQGGVLSLVYNSAEFQRSR